MRAGSFLLPALLFFWGCALLLAPPMIAILYDAAPEALANEPIPNADQSLVRLLWGNHGFDYWQHTFPPGGDSVSYAFLFTTPDSTDVLDLPASLVIASSDVAFAYKVFGADSSHLAAGFATAYIDTAVQTVNADEVISLGVQIWWIHVEASAAGLLRVWAVAD